jgi:hypothetical protein
MIERNIRDDFAMAALSCATDIFLNFAGEQGMPGKTELIIARTAYIIADAMMEVREENEENLAFEELCAKDPN